MRGKIVVGIFALIMGLAAGLGIRSVVASPAGSATNARAHGGPAPGATLVLVSVRHERQSIDLGPPGPSQGDITSSNNVIWNANKTQRLSRVDLFCVYTDVAEEAGEVGHAAQCLGTIKLANGTITWHGEAIHDTRNGAPRFGDSVITGGTGAYLGEAGDLHFTVRGKDLVLTLHFD